jgi:hypothetical protein
MPDNLEVSSGTGTIVGTDLIGGVHYQRVKVCLGLDGAYSGDLDGTPTRGAYVDPRVLQARIVVTPTISTTPAYTTGDCLGGLMTIANAARATGGSGVITSIVVLDKTQAQRAPIDLVFFDRTVTVQGDNTAFAVSDADMANCLGVLAIGAYNTPWPGTPANAVSTFSGVGMPFVLNGSDLFCQAVVRGTPTYTTTSDLVFAFTVMKD